MSDTPVWPRPSPAEARRIDEICDRYEAAWKAGSRPMPEEYLSTAGEPERSALLRQLLFLDWDFRQLTGDRPVSGDYLARFPADHALIEDVSSEMSRHADDTPWSAGLQSNLPEIAVSSSARYELLEEVGRGGAGVVFRGRDRLLGRELAVKVLRDVHRRTPEIYQRFVEEARVGSRLQHPAIVPVYELGWFDDQRPYFTMKLVEGRTLAALLKERCDPAQDRPRLLGVFEQVCQAIAYAHGQQVIHRDLKPANIMVGAFGEVQVMDWGFAKVLGGDGELRDLPFAVQAHGGTEATQSGCMMGTPAYMPPEQARGHTALIDSRADVFALGAILCEILTGRPPYVGTTIEEVCLQAAQGNLADAHARLDACGADEALRELAKRCLTAEREARPAEAATVARDLAAYLASAQERLRQAQLERAAAEARMEEARAKAKAERRARRLTVALAAAAAVFLASVGFGWWQHDRTQQAQALQAATTDGKVAAALAEADEHMKRNDWSGAGAAATRARELLESGASDHWKQRVDELRAELDMVGRIEEARRLAADYNPAARSFPLGEALTRYAEAFGGYGIRVGADPAAVEARLTQQPAPVRDALVAGLEDWWLVARDSDAAAHKWLGTVLQSVDADPWRVQVRAAVDQRDRRKLEALAAKADAAGQPAATVTALARALLKAQAFDAAIALLRPAQQRVPNDFWINLDLGQALEQRQPPSYAEALRFYSIAGALHPGTSVAYEVNLAALLVKQGDWDGAVVVSRKTLGLHPDCAEAYNQLGVGLEHKGDWEQAQAAFRKALELKPDMSETHYNLGLSLEQHGQAAQAVAEFERAVQLAPGDADACYSLGHARNGLKEFDGALAAFARAIELNPGCALAYNDQGNALMEKGRLDEAVAAYEKAVHLNPTMDVACSNLGKALYGQRHLERAVAACCRAVELNPKSATDQYNLGGILQATGDVDGALAAYREAVRLDPSNAEAHCNLRQPLQEQGRFTEALAEIQEGHRLGSAQPDWPYPSGRWLKQAQRLVDLDAKLPAILDGQEKPATGHEQVEFAAVCKLKGLYGASAGLYVGAFDAEPKLATSLDAGCRYQAACVAALAGCSKGRDVPELDAAERARWRKQALNWLRAELAVWADRSDDGSSCRDALQQWRREKALAGIREPEELAKLPASERAGCIQFWGDVTDLLAQRLAP
ncbi:MAG TPA: tetratricopeptide repeat protein [Gemmataceae bacterium]|nr:tetratricopeptide repeat protein [Gemmataceae bacterium]